METTSILLTGRNIAAASVAVAALGIDTQFSPNGCGFRDIREEANAPPGSPRPSRAQIVIPVRDALICPRSQRLQRFLLHLTRNSCQQSDFFLGDVVKMA